MNIIVLTGGLSSERNVAIKTGRAITSGLKELGFNVKVVDPVFGVNQPSEEQIFNSRPEIGREFPTVNELKAFSNRKVLDCINSSIFDNVDFVFLGLHGKFGEDGKIQALLEMRGVNYSGSKVVSSAVSMDKHLSKLIFLTNNIPTPAWFMVDNYFSRAEMNNRIKNSYSSQSVVIKPNDEGSTVGLSILKPDYTDIELEKALNLAFEYTNKVMVEEFIPGRELTVAILGDETLPLVEIIPIDGFYDYEHKYSKGMTDYICPAVLPAEIENELKLSALAAHKALYCHAYSRVDFRMNDKNEFYCLEVNTLPGMTETSLVPKAANARNISFHELLKKIIELSLK
jgi:D-alanine-D-alanine ligase